MTNASGWIGKENRDFVRDYVLNLVASFFDKLNFFMTFSIIGGALIIATIIVIIIDKDSQDILHKHALFIAASGAVVSATITFCIFCIKKIREIDATLDAVRSSLDRKNVKYVMSLTDMVEAFDSTCVDAIKDPILLGANECIYAIDWSPAETWLTNGSLGYLALQGQWRSNAKDRKVYRIFVWDKIRMLESKVLAIHALMGFSTIIIRKSKMLHLNGVTEGQVRSGLPKGNRMRDILFWDFPITDKGVIDSSARPNGCAMPLISGSGKEKAKYVGYRASFRLGERSDSHGIGDLEAVDVEEAAAYADIFNKVICCCGKSAIIDEAHCTHVGFIPHDYFAVNTFLNLTVKLSNMAKGWGV